MAHATIQADASPARGAPRRRPVARARRGIHRGWITYAITLAVYAAVFGVWQAQPLPPEVHATGVLVAAICLFPIFLWQVRGSQGVPMFELICGAYLLQFGMPVYLQPASFVLFSRSVPFSSAETETTLLLVALGVACMICGYYLTQRSRLRYRLPRVDLPLDPTRRGTYLVAAFGFGFGMTVFQVTSLAPSGSGPLGALIRILSAQLTIAIILVAYRYYRREITGPRWALLLYGSIAGSELLGLATGFIESVLIPLVLLFVIRWHVTRRFAGRWLLIGFVAFVLLQSVKGEYRQVAWQGNASFLNRIVLWFEMPSQVIQTTFTGDVPTNVQTLVRQSMVRFDFFHNFEWVHRMTPSVVPYYNGSTYSYLLYGWIPRAVWPDKPMAQNSHVQLEVDYGLVAANQSSGATIGIGQISEAYANFDWLGVVIVLALQGMIFAILGEILNGPESQGGRAIYLWIMAGFLNGIGTDTNTMFGALPQNAIAAALVLRVFSTGWRAPTGQVPPRIRRLPAQLRRPNIAGSPGTRR
jgi:hypothetical protein